MLTKASNVIFSFASLANFRKGRHWGWCKPLPDGQVEIFIGYPHQHEYDGYSMTRAEARMIAKRIMECLDYTKR